MQREPKVYLEDIYAACRKFSHHLLLTGPCLSKHDNLSFKANKTGIWYSIPLLPKHM